MWHYNAVNNTAQLSQATWLGPAPSRFTARCLQNGPCSPTFTPKVVRVPGTHDDVLLGGTSVPYFGVRIVHATDRWRGKQNSNRQHRTRFCLVL